MAVMIDKETKEAVPFTAFVKGERLAKDIAKVNDAAGGRAGSVVGMALALMRNYDPFKAPTHFKLSDLLQKFDKTFGATGHDYGSVSGDRTQDDISKRRSDRWNFLFVAGMCSRICLITIFVVPRGALFLTRHKKERYPFVPTTRASGGGTLLKTCT